MYSVVVLLHNWVLYEIAAKDTHSKVGALWGGCKVKESKMTLDLSTYRALFPVTEKFVFLNNAAESPLNIRVHQKLTDYLQLTTCI